MVSSSVVTTISRKKSPYKYSNTITKIHNTKNNNRMVEKRMYSTLFHGLSFLLYTTCVTNAFMNGGRLGSSLASFSSLRRNKNRNRNNFQTKSYFLSSPSVRFQFQFQFQFQILQLKKASEDDYDYYANSNSNSNQSFNINDYYSSLSMKELRDIASQRGYDTFGMDKDGLETIARGWSPSMFKVPDQSKYQTVIVDDVEYEYLTPDDDIVNVNVNEQLSKLETLQKEREQKAKRDELFKQKEEQSRRLLREKAWQEKQIENQLVTKQQLQFTQQQRLSPSSSIPQSFSSSSSSSSPQSRQLSPQREQPEQKKDDIIIANNEQSLKAAFVGFCAGGVAVSPFTYVHNIFFPVEIITNQISQWEFDTVQGAVAAGAFAAVYRYFVKEEKDEALVSCIFVCMHCMHACFSHVSLHFQHSVSMYFLYFWNMHSA